MKGPHERVKYDFRRLWECPVCRHRERGAGEIPYRVCSCQEAVLLVKQLPMRLIEEGGRRVIPEYPHPAAGQREAAAAIAEDPTTVAIVSPLLPEPPTVIETTAVPAEPVVERGQDPPQ